MLTAIIRSKKLRAIGSAMDVCPTGDYSEHVPVVSASAAIGGYWTEVGKYLGTAIEQHNKTSKHCEHEPSRRG